MGHGTPPEWYTILAAAEAWGRAPWEIEADAPAIWMDRFVALGNAKAKASKKPPAKPGVRRLD
jgi:hypothetical protein